MAKFFSILKIFKPEKLNFHVFSPNENIIFYFYIFIDYWDESVENHYQTIFYIMAGPLEIRLMVLPEQQANLSYCHMT